MSRYVPGVFAVPTPDGTTVITPNKVFWVDPVGGATDNDGRSPAKALTKVSAAYDLCTDGQNDVVVLIGRGTGTAPTSGTSAAETTAITWAKSFTHLVGMCSPVTVSPRSRIVANAASLSPFFSITGNGCIFANVQIATFQATGLVNVYMTGDRNYFVNCHLAGIGDATAGDDTTSRSLHMVGASENRFYRCTIGLDTAARSDANAEIEFSTACTRNEFEDCKILSYADNAGHFFVIANAAADIDRYVWFKNCVFLNATFSAGTTMTDAFSLHAAVGGTVLLTDCTKVGCTGWSDDRTAMVCGGYSSNATYANGIGFPVTPGA